jgi:superfamily I DNA/RNA helicase
VDVVLVEHLPSGVVETVIADRAMATEFEGGQNGGSIAVIASESLLASVYPALAASFGADVGRGPVGLGREIAVLTPQEAKGLEFDSVIVVDPQRIVDEIARGAAALYVSMTRPTQRLHLVTTGPLPVGID